MLGPEPAPYLYPQTFVRSWPSENIESSERESGTIDGSRAVDPVPELWKIAQGMAAINTSKT